MATKKKKPSKRVSKQEARSKAARKGWNTRRKNELAAQIKVEQKKIVNAAKARRKKPRKSKAIATSRKELERQLRESEAMRLAQEKIIERATRFDDFVPAVDIEWLHIDGTLALYPSIARHLPDASRIYNTLKRADKEGEEALFITVESIAQKFDLEVRDLYTLLRSP